LILNTRFAPTPSGYLHAGNAFNFILNWRIAKLTNGKIRLRMDDIDVQRTQNEYIQHIFDAIEFLGLDYDDGPKNILEQQQIYSQTHFIALYQKYLNRLIESKQVYKCTCSRKEIMQYSNQGKYNGFCRDRQVSENKEFAWRLKVDKHSNVTWNSENQTTFSVYEHFPDPVLWRKDGIPAYQLVSVIDDFRMGINCLIRGEDLQSSTILQLYLIDKLELKKPDFIFHHPLILDNFGNKLSKSAGSTSLKHWVNQDVKHFYAYLSSLFHLPKCSNAIDFADAWLEKNPII